MFQYEYEKRPASANSCESQATMTTDWSRSYASTGRAGLSAERGPRRPLPPRPIVCERIPTKTTVPLKVWIIASASCFAVCAALVLATVVITKWGATERYTTRELYAEPPEPIYSSYPKNSLRPEDSTTEELPSIDIENDIPILEKLSIFKNIVGNRDKKKLDLISKPQIHPVHDNIHHVERKIEKKDQAKLPEHLKNFDFNKFNVQKAIDLNLNVKNVDTVKQTHVQELNKIVMSEHNNVNIPEHINDLLPEFKPIKSDVTVKKHTEIKLPEDYLKSLKSEVDYEEYYNDENLYDDYMQSNTMTNYLIEKVQELYSWITTDPDFEIKNSTLKKSESNSQFGQVLKALNESLVEGNVTIIMNTLKDIYFGDHFSNSNHSKKMILTNSTDLVSFGILTLDVMLLHNIQMMAWENQEASRTKMMKDPDVFTFNALFLDPSKVDAKQNEVQHSHENSIASKRQTLRQDITEDYDFGKNLLENVLEIGMSSARAAIHLGRAYKNTRMILNQLSNKDTNIPSQIPRNIDANAHALNRLQTSFNGSVANMTGEFYTELDCVWMLYCKNLVATSKLNPPYGTMARINGMALRMLAGELSADKALDTMVYEVLTGWTELKCSDMFPRCSKVNAASVVMETILQPLKKSQSTNRGR